MDDEFQRSRLSSLLALERSNLVSAKHAFEQAFVALDYTPPDTLTACRRIFEAIEVAAKALTPSESIARLGATEVDRWLNPPVLRRFDADPIARNNAQQIMTSLKAWVNGLQAYRHGQDTPEPIQPPLDLAIAIIGAGATYLRFLVETLSPRVQSTP